MIQNLLLEMQPIFLALDWIAIRNFMLGFMTGIVLLMLSIAFIFSRNERKKTRVRMSKSESLDQEALFEMINNKKNQLDRTVKLTNNSYINVALDLSLELTEDIARYYFPKSKYPLYELSVQEMLDLAKYITERLDKLVNGNFVKMFKNYRVSSIIDMINAKKRLDDSKVMKLTRKLRLQKLYSGFRAVVNYANPIYWFRKLAIKPTTVLAMKEISKYIITIFGEETNKIYSKAIFKEEDNQEEMFKQLEAYADAPDEESKEEE